jgi:UDP-glucose 4-epimerase
MRWLITGGCGFIGTNLIRELQTEKDHFIRVVDNLSVGSREDLARVCTFSEYGGQEAHVELIVGDILDEKLALDATRNIDVIVHLAANTGVGPSVENPRQDCLANVIGTLNYLEAARHNKVRRFVFASSGAPVGECNPPIHEELPPHPVSPYGASKLAGEGYCSAYFRSFSVETVCLRFGNVYGPLSGHKSSVVAKFIRKALLGETLEIYGDGGQSRDFIYVGDLVHAVLQAATVENIGGEVFQIATHSETTVNELLNSLQAILVQAGIDNVRVINTQPRVGDVRRNFSDTTKARLQLKWQPEVELREGLRKTLNWWLSQNYIETK